MKEQFSSFDVAAIVKEAQCLVGGFIDNIYQLNSTDVVFKINTKGHGKKNLMVRSGRFVWFTERAIDAPSEPTSFAMKMRKHITNGFIDSIVQHHFDRVIVLTIQKKDKYQIIFELFGEGNIIFTENGIILQPLRSEEWKSRMVKAGNEYVFPPSKQNPFTFTKDEIASLFRNSTSDAVRTAASVLGLPGIYAEELCAAAKIKKNAPANSIPATDFDALYIALHNLWKLPSEPVIVSKDGIVADVLPCNIGKYASYEAKKFPSFSAAVDEYIRVAVGSKRDEAARGEMMHLTRQYQQQSEVIEQMRLEIIGAKQKAEAVLLHHNECEAVLNAVLAAKQTHRDWDVVIGEVAKENPAIAEVDPSAMTVTFRVQHILAEGGAPKEVAITLDLRKTARENANHYYTLSKKARERLAGASAALTDTEKKIQELKEKQESEVEFEVDKDGFPIDGGGSDGSDASLESGSAQNGIAGSGSFSKGAPGAGPKKSATKHFWFEDYRWFFTSDGYLVVGGRDAKTNEQVVKKHLGKNDIYVHAEIHGAPSVVIKRSSEFKVPLVTKSEYEDDELEMEKDALEDGDVELDNVAEKNDDSRNDAGVPDKTVSEAGQFSVAHSRAWAAAIGSADAYWVLPEQVSKTPNTGEYLAKGAFVIRGRRNPIGDLGIKLAIGMTQINGSARLMCGPVSAVESRCRRYITMEPGITEKEEFAKYVAKKLGGTAAEAIRVLPPGDVKILKEKL